jgi:hypothetical protein
MEARSFAVAVMAVALGAACAGDPAAPAPTTSIVSIVPAGGATRVDPAAAIVITFSHPMQEGMEQYAALHEGSLTGPIVPGTWSWSVDRAALTFTPDAPLGSGTTYALHLGGGMRDAMGGPLDYQQCLDGHGGQWATGAMMGMGGGMMGDWSMMGPGWRHANGSYGIVFTFTTA